MSDGSFADADYRVVNADTHRYNRRKIAMGRQFGTGVSSSLTHA
jgi:hypothetical protein